MSFSHRELAQHVQTSGVSAQYHHIHMHAHTQVSACMHIYVNTMNDNSERLLHFQSKRNEIESPLNSHFGGVQETNKGCPVYHRISFQSLRKRSIAVTVTESLLFPGVFSISIRCEKVTHHKSQQFSPLDGDLVTQQLWPLGSLAFQKEKQPKKADLLHSS